MIARLAVALLVACCVASSLHAAEPAAPAAAWPPTITRKLPPPTVPLSAADQTKVEAALAEMRSSLSQLPVASEATRGARSDVEILAKAVDYAVRHGEFFDPKKDVERVEMLRKLTAERVAALHAGNAPWATQRGPVVRGFRSQLDDSYQPYGLVIPEKLDLSKPVPLYVWLHGRGDKQCDLQFISQFTGTKSPGPLQPANAIVLHPFGRYCNGFKSAGEIDVLESIEDVKKKYKIDADRIVLAGFSMGGAGAWHMGAHYADKWCAVHAGAGFVDVRRYQKLTPDKMPPAIEQTLWGLYDVPDYRRNLLNVPVLAYSGEDDAQKAAADIMEAELVAEGLKIPHLIGPKMGHKYHPDALVEIHDRLAQLVEQGRESYPQKVSLQTKTLRYNRMKWASVQGLEHHWEEARLDAEIVAPNRVEVRTKNVTEFVLQPPQVEKPFAAETAFVVDGETLSRTTPEAIVPFFKRDGHWILGRPPLHTTVGRKDIFVHGPIDDGFLRRFVVVPPLAKGKNELVDRWAEFESQHFIDRWRLLMRGEPNVARSSAAVRIAMAAKPNSTVALWGTPQTNPEIAAILSSLPITWTETTVGMGDLKFDAKKVVPMLIYPTQKTMPPGYVVINSGLTFREGHDRTNSLQNPKLGDWAFVDVTEPPTDEAPGKVLASGFFDEEWKYVPAK